MSLKKDIENGESKNIEFKIELPSSNILAKTVIAFSNTGGGKIKTKDVKNILNVEERRAREVLKGLVDRQFIIKKGKGPSTFYELK